MSSQTPRKGTAKEKAAADDAQKVINQPENVETPKDEETPVEPTTTPENTPPAPPEETPKVDYEEKFRASTREAQRLNTALKELTNTAPPTEDELQKRFTTWDLMTESEREIATTQFANERSLKAMQVKQALEEEDRRWKSDYQNVVTTNPALREHEQEFRDFAYEQENHGIPLPRLAESFLFRLSQKKSAPAPTPAKPGLESGSGGVKDNAPKPKYTAEEVKEIRTSDPKRYNDMVRRGEVQL